MINDFEDFCTWMYMIVDDIWQQSAPLFKRPGPKPECSDSELITMTIVGECRGWDVETEMRAIGKNIEICFLLFLRKAVLIVVDAT